MVKPDLSEREKSQLDTITPMNDSAEQSNIAAPDQLEQPKLLESRNLESGAPTKSQEHENEPMAAGSVISEGEDVQIAEPEIKIVEKKRSSGMDRDKSPAHKLHMEAKEVFKENQIVHKQQMDAQVNEDTLEDPDQGSPRDQLVVFLQNSPAVNAKLQ